MTKETAQINVEVVCATELRQKVVRLQVPVGTVLAEAIELSDIATEFPELEFSTCSMGIYGKLESISRILAEGDRVEIYRPLQISPMQARLNRVAAAKKQK